MKMQEVIAQLNSVIERYYVYSGSKEQTFRQLTGLITSARAVVERLAPVNSPYRQKCDEILQASFSEDHMLDGIIGIVESLRDDLNIGSLSPIQEIIRAEVFDDFLDMATHLLEIGCKDPAAVLIGGVLEQHLRKLCVKYSISTETEDKPKKADLMNSELSAKNAYNKLDLKSITSWLDLRNKAAHAEYGAYTQEQVRTMLFGVRDFISRTVA